MESMENEAHNMSKISLSRTQLHVPWPGSSCKIRMLLLASPPPLLPLPCYGRAHVTTATELSTTRHSSKNFFDCRSAFARFKVSGLWLSLNHMPLCFHSVKKVLGPTNSSPRRDSFPKWRSQEPGQSPPETGVDSAAILKTICIPYPTACNKVGLLPEMRFLVLRNLYGMSHQLVKCLKNKRNQFVLIKVFDISSHPFLISKLLVS